jgi:hypothetical protein
MDDPPALQSAGRPLSMLDMPGRMNELWEWVCALCAWDFGDPKPIAALLREQQAVPAEFARALASIVDGTRKPNRKAGAKLRVPAAELLRAAGSISVVTGLCDQLRLYAIDDRFTSRGAVMLADRLKTEPIEQVKALQTKARETIERSAQELGVSVETIENWLRELRRRIERWPEV